MIVVRKDITHYERVQNGVRVLDKVVPSWRARIHNIARLDIANYHWCIIAQLNKTREFSTYHVLDLLVRANELTGVNIHHLSSIEVTDLCAFYGFTIYYDEEDTDRNAGILTDLWIEAIRGVS